MARSNPVAIRSVIAGVACWAALVGGAGTAGADPAPNCTAADLARTSAGVSTATADYLSANPDVNTFFTGLKGQDPETLRVNVEAYLNTNPQIKAALEGLRAPLAEFEAQCL